MAIGVLALGQASAMASRAATQVVQASSGLPNHPAKQAVQSLPSAPSLPPILPPVETQGVIGGIVDMMRAKTAYKAAAAIVRTGGEMQKEVLRLV